MNNQQPTEPLSGFVQSLIGLSLADVLTPPDLVKIVSEAATLPSLDFDKHDVRVKARTIDATQFIEIVAPNTPHWREEIGRAAAQLDGWLHAPDFTGKTATFYANREVQA